MALLRVYKKVVKDGSSAAFGSGVSRQETPLMCEKSLSSGSIRQLAAGELMAVGSRCDFGGR